MYHNSTRWLCLLGVSVLLWGIVIGIVAALGMIGFKLLETMLFVVAEGVSYG